MTSPQSSFFASVLVVQPIWLFPVSKASSDENQPYTLHMDTFIGLVCTLITVTTGAIDCELGSNRWIVPDGPVSPVVTQDRRLLHFTLRAVRVLCRW